MQHRFLRLLFMLAVLFALGESRAHAEVIDFSYHWAIQPSTVIASGTGSVQFALASDSSAQATLGAVSPVLIPGATLTTTSSASSGAPDSYNAPYSLKLTLTDTASSATGNLT